MNRSVALAFALVTGSLVAACGAQGDVARPYGATLPAFAQTAMGVDWSTDARAFRGMNTLHVRFDCPAGGVLGTVYGSDLYTDDSSVCTAGVHSGRITVAGGGPVIIELRAGAASYAEATRYGVTTNAYLAYDGSFTVL